MSAESRVLVFHDLDGRSDGEYENSPRHITLLPPISIPDNELNGFLNSLSIVAHETKHFNVTRGEEALFGPNHDIVVDKINDTEGRLQTLHNDLLQVAWLHELSRNVDMTYAGLRYSPHSTRKNGIIFPEAHTIRNLSMYRRIGDSAIRSIRRFDFGG